MSNQDPSGRRPRPLPAQAEPEAASWEHHGPTLDQDGYLVDAGSPPAPRAGRTGHTGRAAPARARPLHEEPPLELADIGPRQARVSAPREFAPADATAKGPGLLRRVATAAGRRIVRRLVVSLVLGAVGLGVAVLRKPVMKALGGRGEVKELILAPTGEAPSGTLMVFSEPLGATVRIQGRDVGTTPFAVDNTWRGDAVPLEVVLPGYRPWKSTFRGGEATQLRAELRRR
jgi:PEGA domain